VAAVGGDGVEVVADRRSVADGLDAELAVGKYSPLVGD